jgi:flagellar biosynthesis protein FlhG
MESAGHPGPSPSTSPSPIQEREARPSIWALAGGKGGVGRTLLAANLGIQIARAGRRVVLVDLDLQGCNLQLSLGYQRLPRSLGDLASGKVALLSELACETPIPHLRVIGGLQRGELRDDPVAFVRQIAEQFGTLSADHIIVDCGSGRLPATVAAFSESTLGILVGTPEPAAIEAVYLFTEAHLRWCMVRALTGESMGSIEARFREAGIDPARTSFRTFMTRLAKIDPAARDAIAAVVRRTQLQLLLNQVRGEADEEVSASLASGFRKCFGLNLHFAGAVEHDLSVLMAVQKRRSLSQQYPNAASTKGMARAATRLLSVAVGPLRPADEEWEDLEEVDHYRVLEVVPKASPKEVQSAYQLLKKTYDPETTYLSSLMEAPGLRDLQTRIEGAYRTLIFLESRSEYDRHMREKSAAGSAGPPAPSLELAGGEAVPGPTGEPGAVPPPASSAATEPAPPVHPEGDAAASPQTPAVEPTPAPSTLPTPTSGAELRDARQRLRLSLETIAERTKIRRAYLQAIEEERFSDLPAAVFLRGFLREYARCLGLQAEDVARLYMKRYQDWHESRGPSGGPPVPFSNN